MFFSLILPSDGASQAGSVRPQPSYHPPCSVPLPVCVEANKTQRRLQIKHWLVFGICRPFACVIVFLLFFFPSIPLPVCLTRRCCRRLPVKPGIKTKSPYPISYIKRRWCRTARGRSALQLLIGWRGTELQIIAQRIIGNDAGGQQMKTIETKVEKKGIAPSKNIKAGA